MNIISGPDQSTQTPEPLSAERLTDVEKFRRTLEDAASAVVEAQADEIAREVVTAVWNAVDDERGRIADGWRAQRDKLLAEVERLKAENHATWDAHGKRFLRYAQTIHELRAERKQLKAEVERKVARVAELEAQVERLRNAVRDSYRTAMHEAEQARDYDRVAALRLELRNEEDAWQADDTKAGA